MHVLLAWLEASALGHAVRSSGIWSYAILNLVHIVGVATLFGAILILDLRLLGLWQRIPIAAVAAPAVPLAAGGFATAAATGIAMLTTNATDYVGNPFLLIKFPAIALGLVNVLVLRTLPAWRHALTRAPQGRERGQLAIAGAASLTCWSAALAAGRMIGYW